MRSARNFFSIIAPVRRWKGVRQVQREEEVRQQASSSTINLKSLCGGSKSTFGLCCSPHRIRDSHRCQQRSYITCRTSSCTARQKAVQLIEFISSASLLSYLEARLEVSSQNTTFLPCSSTSVNSSNDFFEAGSDGGSSFSLLPWPTLRHFSAYLAEPLPPPFTSAATLWLDLVVTFS